MEIHKELSNSDACCFWLTLSIVDETYWKYVLGYCLNQNQPDINILKIIEIDGTKLHSFTLYHIFGSFQAA